MSFIIGTAGHIDHGKTSLVKALTGQNTDRLKEEQERGITTDLGFAHFDLPPGARIGVVDVPGHERFIRHMLAGAHGIDLVLFTVAADDGVMPQTQEHLDIVHLLGIRRGIWVITKADLVDDVRLRQVERDIRSLASGTALVDAPVLPFSFPDGRGLDAIRAGIAEALRPVETRHSTGYFRLPIDRVFTMRGHGIVVTGTAISGTVEAGANVRCLPGGGTLRVRQIQVHGLPAPSATEGQRVALNLAGPELETLDRGHVICDHRLTRVSRRFDATLELRTGAHHALKNHQRVRVHVGTAEREGRVRLLDRNALNIGEATYCQVELVAPMHVVRGDRFVIRDETAQRTLGGGVILHPSSRRHRAAHRAAALEHLAALHRGAFQQIVVAFVEMDGRFDVPLAALSELMNAPDIRDRIAQMTAIRLIEGESCCVLASRWTGLVASIEAALRQFHSDHPLAPGMDAESLRGSVAAAVSAKVFRAALDDLQRRGVVARDAHMIRLSTHGVQANAGEQAALDTITRLLRDNPVAPPDVAALDRELGYGRAKLAELIRVLERQRAVVRISADLYFAAESVDRLGQLVRERWNNDQDITPAAFRDAVGTTRKYAIPLLEYFDRVGVTFRRGDSRRVRAESHGREANTP